LEVTDAASLLRACLSHLAASEARLVLANLEDLWLETQAQNVPSTWDQHPNWQRKARLSFEEFREEEQVLGELRAVDRARRDGSNPTR